MIAHGPGNERGPWHGARRSSETMHDQFIRRERQWPRAMRLYRAAKLPHLLERIALALERGGAR